MSKMTWVTKFKNKTGSTKNITVEFRDMETLKVVNTVILEITATDPNIGLLNPPNQFIGSVVIE